MPADFSEYIDLTIHDRDAGELYREMIESARVFVPEFVLRRGTIEDAIFQSIAYTSVVATNSINRVPDSLMQGIVSLLGYQRNYGIRATATATVELYGTTGSVFSQGTEFRYRYVDPSAGTQTDYLFVASEDTVIADGSPPTATISLICENAGELPEPTLGSTPLTPLSVDNDINTVVFASFNNGTEPDSDFEYLNAAKTYMETLSSTYVTARQLEAAILTDFSYVSRCKVYDLMDLNTDRGVLTFLPDETKNVTSSNYKGYVAVFVYGFNRNLTSDELAAIQLYVARRVVAGLEVNVHNFETVSMDVAITASYDSNYDQSVIIDEIKSVVSTILSPGSFPYDEVSVSSPKIRDTLINSELFYGIPGLVYVSSISITPPAALPYTLVESNGGDAQFTVSSTSGLSVGQRIKISSTSGDYTSTSVAIKSLTATKITIDVAYTADDTGDIYGNFAETTASSSLNFLNRGVLPDIETSNVTVTLVAEAI